MIEIKALASGSRGNCYRVTDGSTPLLLECGLSIREIRQGIGFGLTEIAACLISHEHKDHSKAVQDVMKAGVTCCMSQGTAEALEVTGHRLQLLRARTQVRIGTWTVLPFETQHDAAEPLGFLLANQAGEKLLFATDSYYVKYRFQGLTHVMLECNYADDILAANVAAGAVPAGLKDRLLQSHFSLANVKEFLKANDLSRVEEIWLLHLSDGNSDAATFKREIMELTGKPVYIPGGR